jgi:hypothetical protein
LQSDDEAAKFWALQALDLGFTSVGGFPTLAAWRRLVRYRRERRWGRVLRGAAAGGLTCVGLGVLRAGVG